MVIFKSKLCIKQSKGPNWMSRVLSLAIYFRHLVCVIILRLRSRWVFAPVAGSVTLFLFSNLHVRPHLVCEGVASRQWE